MNTHSCSNITSGKRKRGRSRLGIEIPNRLAADHDRLAALEGGAEAQGQVQLEAVAPERAEHQVKRHQDEADRQDPEEESGDLRQDEREGQDQDDHRDADEERRERVQVLLAVRLGLARTTPVGLLAVDSEVEPAVLDVHVHFVSFVRNLQLGGRVLILTRQREITPVRVMTGLNSRCYHLLMYLGGVNDCTSTKHAYYSTNIIKMQYL